MARTAPLRSPRASAGRGFVRWVELDAAGIETAGYPFGLPVVAALRELGRLVLDPGVTLLTGDNGTGGLIASSYGGRSPHERSHGESFLAPAVHRFGPGGLYLLDEPESALSTPKPVPHDHPRFHDDAGHDTPVRSVMPQLSS